MSSRAPSLARLLLGLLCSREDRELVLADLDERFLALQERRGLAAARRWYWSQALRALPALLSPDLEAARLRSWEGTMGDVRFSLRSLRRRPLYAIGVLGTLALGLGSAATVFGVAWTVWLAPMPFPDPDRVVRLYELRDPDQIAFAGDVIPDRGRWRLSPPLIEDLRRHEWSSIAAVAGVSQDIFDWEREGELSRVSALVTSHELFGILGIVPSLGRTLSDVESAKEIVLTRSFWESAFGSDPRVVESAMTLNGLRYRIVGVVELPAGYPQAADVVTRLDFTEDDLSEGMRGARYLDAVARVRPSASVSDASNEVDRFVRTLGEDISQHRDWGSEAVVLGDDLVKSYRAILTLLLAAGLSFLALAIVNVGGLVAARRIEGRNERAVRLALGASEARLLRYSVIEGLLVGAVGSVAGLLAAHWMFVPIRALVPADVPRLAEVGVDFTIGSAVVLVGLAAGAVVGALSYGLSRSAGARTTRTVTTAGLGGRRILVVGQVALTTLLLTGGVAILRHMMSLQAIDLGFEPDGVRSSSMVISQARYPTKESQRGVWESVLEGLAAQGLDAALAINTPMAGSTMPFGFRLDAASEQAFAQYHTVSPSYFGVMGIELVDGRPFLDSDDDGAAPVVIVNDHFVREHFPDGGALGREIRVVSTPRTIVGVAEATRHFGPDAELREEMYVPLAQDTWAFGNVLFRTPREDVHTALESVLVRVDPDLAFPPLGDYSRYVTAWYAPLRLQLVIVGVLAVVGLALASLGLYALVAYHVTSRSREIGIRLALGAPSARLFTRVVVQGVLMSAIGLAAGLGGWYAMLPLTSGLMEGIDTAGALVPLSVAAVVGAVSVVATLVPAWRSTNVDPSATLQAE